MGTLMGLLVFCIPLLSEVIVTSLTKTLHCYKKRRSMVYLLSYRSKKGEGWLILFVKSTNKKASPFKKNNTNYTIRFTKK
jgi:hypothetical protein